MEMPETLLCRYVYDALDRLTGLLPSKQEEVQRFYNSAHLATELQGLASRTVFQQGTQLLVLQQREGEELNNQLLATDQQRSVLYAIDGVKRLPTAYTPYGHRRAESGLSSLLGFNGERPDPVTGHYLLGNGHRAFNPVLMRFNSPDRLSPFGRGGLNPYAYCLGDPVNRSDPSGRESLESWLFLGLGIIGLAGTLVGALPTISFLEAVRSLKKGPVTRRAFAKVVGTTTGIVAGTLGVGRLALNIGDPDSEDSKILLYVGAALGGLSLLGAGGATFLSWRASRGVKAKATTVFTQTSNTSSFRGSSLVQPSPRESLTPGLYDPSAPTLTPGIDLNQYDWMNPETKAALNNLGRGPQSSRNTSPRNSITDIRQD